MLFELLATTPATNTLLIGLLIPILGVASPLLLARQINRNALATKQQDWERQDLVAQRAAEADARMAEASRLIAEQQNTQAEKTERVAELLETSKEETKAAAVEVARLLKISTDNTEVQLKTIHGLVNSQMTDAIRSELGATRDTLALMRELIESHKRSGIEPSIEVLAAVKGRESKVLELEDTLKSRLKADAVAIQTSGQKSSPQEVVIVNPEPVPVKPVVEKEDPIPVVQDQKPLPVVDVYRESKDSK